MLGDGVDEQQCEQRSCHEGVAVVEGYFEPVQVCFLLVDLYGDGPLKVNPKRGEHDDYGYDGKKDYPEKPLSRNEYSPSWRVLFQRLHLKLMVEN